MNIFKLLSAILCAKIAIMAAACAADVDADFSGTWRGVLQKIDPLLHDVAFPDLSVVPEELEYAVEISENAARVYLLLDGSWVEIKPGAFGYVTHETNAVVAAMDSAMSEDRRSGWVETWNFTLTKNDGESLLAYWVRVVNNPHLVAGSTPDARFFMSRFGTLKRSSPIPDPNLVQVSSKTGRSQCLQENLVCGEALRQLDTQKMQKINQRK